MSFLFKAVEALYRHLAPSAGEPVQERRPEPRLEKEIESFLLALDLPDAGARDYVRIHMKRFVHTLAATPPGNDADAVLELGAYMQMTPALRYVLHYRDVRGAYIGPVGRTDHKTMRVPGGELFECDVDLFNAEKDRWPYEDDRFQTVLACEIFEHFLHDPMHMLLEARRVLTDNGALVVTTPNVASYTAVVRALEGETNPQLYSRYANPRGEFADQEVGHMREYTPKELQEALTCAGLRVETIFTESPPFYEANVRIRETLERLQYPTRLRGEQMYCVARKVPGAEIIRYPGFLYDS